MARRNEGQGDGDLRAADAGVRRHAVRCLLCQSGADGARACCLSDLSQTAQGCLEGGLGKTRACALADAAGRKIAAQPLEINGAAKKQLTFAFDFEGAGVFTLAPVAEPQAFSTTESLMKEPTVLLSSGTFAARLNRDGSIRELRLSNGSTLISDTDSPGGQLTVAVGDFIEDLRDHVGSVRIVRGPVFDLLEANGRWERSLSSAVRLFIMTSR